MAPVESLTTDDRLTLMDRLRCRYATGPIVNGKPEFGWRSFAGPAPQGVMLPTPLMLEAADEIERLQGELYLLRNERDNLADNVHRLTTLPAVSEGSIDSRPASPFDVGGKQP